MQRLGEQAFPGSGHQLPQEEEMRRLQRENELLRKARDNLKKPSGHLLAQPADIAFRSLHNTVTSTRLGCCAPRLRLKTRGYYAWKKREPSQHSREDAVLHAAIQQSFVEFRQVYGSPRLHAVLKSRGIACSRKRIARLMQPLGLSAHVKKRRKPTTQSSPAGRFAPNMLNRDFAAHLPNQKWADDTTAIPTGDRLVVPGGHPRSLLTAGRWLALRMALGKRQPPAGLLHYSDRGSEFSCDRYQAVLRQAGCEVSMSRTGDCYDNAVMEAFFATLTKECTNRLHFQTRQEARSTIFEYLECFYHPIRIHSTLQYVSPVAFPPRNPRSSQRSLHFVVSIFLDQDQTPRPFLHVFRLPINASLFNKLVAHRVGTERPGCAY